MYIHTAIRGHLNLLYAVVTHQVKFTEEKGGKIMSIYLWICLLLFRFLSLIHVSVFTKAHCLFLMIYLCCVTLVTPKPYVLAVVH